MAKRLASLQDNGQGTVEHIKSPFEDQEISAISRCKNYSRFGSYGDILFSKKHEIKNFIPESGNSLISSPSLDSKSQVSPIRSFSPIVFPFILNKIL